MPGTTEEEHDRVRKLFVLLPRLLLAFPADFNSGAHAEHLQYVSKQLNAILVRRVNSFLDLNFDALFKEAADNTLAYKQRQARRDDVIVTTAPTTTPPATSTTSITSTPLEPKKQRRVMLEVALGNVNKASSLLASDAVFKDASDPDVKQQLLKLYNNKQHQST